MSTGSISREIGRRGRQRRIREAASVSLRRYAGREWRWFLLRGAAALIAGALFVIFPFETSVGFAVAFAAFAVIDGLFSIGAGLDGARTLDQRASALTLRGVVGLAIGLASAAIAVIGSAPLFAMLLLLVAWALLAGLLELAAAVSVGPRIEADWLPAGSGLASLMLAVALLAFVISYPGATLLSVAWMVGTYALGAGLLLIGHGVGLGPRKAGPR